MKSHTVTAAESSTGIVLAPNPPHPRLLGPISAAEYTASFASVDEAEAYAKEIVSARPDIEAWVDAATRFYSENGTTIIQNSK